MLICLDSSAAAKLLVEEPGSAALAGLLDQAVARGDGLYASILMETELRRLAQRMEVPQVAVTEVLARVSLVEPSRSLFYEAGLLPGMGLRSLDALHLATALRLSADEFVTYDHRQGEAAANLGFRVTAP